jgi:transcriptional regulator with XRE-family HTH domain
MKEINPFKRWLIRQPPELTQMQVADKLGVTRSYMSHLMSDTDPRMPSLDLAVKIEAATDGHVTPTDMHRFVARNLRRRK